MDYRKQRNSSLDKDLSIAFTGKQLASSPPFYEDIKTIQSLVALPNEYYSAFYQTSLENFLAIYQVLGIEHIQLKLKRIIKALKMRRSYNLPIGVQPEDVREKKDLWTYVIFVSALLYNLPDITRYKILHKSPDKIHDYTLWNPYLGAITAGHYYMTKKNPGTDTHLISPTLFSVILTQHCITWLYSEPEAFNRTLELITSPNQDTILGNLIISSHNQSSQKKHIGHDLYSLIIDVTQGNIDSSDKVHNYLCLTHDGYAIAIPDIFNYYSTVKKEDPKEIEECFNSLETHKPSNYKVTFPNIGKKDAIILTDNEKSF
jgi:hypothetical protein